MIKSLESDTEFGTESVQFSRSAVSNSAIPWTAALPVHHQLPEPAQTHVH